MTTSYLDYDLNAQYIHQWLVAGPLALPTESPKRATAPHRKQANARQRPDHDSGVADLPEEKAAFTVEGEALTWRHYDCREDHLVELSVSVPTPHRLIGFAYARMKAPAPQEATLVVTGWGQADLWVNGEHVHHHGRGSGAERQTSTLQCLLQEGPNDLLIRAEQAGAGAVPFALALQVLGLPPHGAVQIPSATDELDRRRAFEQMVQAAFIRRDCCGGRDLLTIEWTDAPTRKLPMGIQVRKVTGEVFAEARPTVGPSFTLDLLAAQEVPDGAYEVHVTANLEEYYLAMRVARDLEVNLLQNRYTAASEAPLPARAVDVLRHAARRHSDIFAEIAKMELKWWPRVDRGAIRDTIEKVRAREVDSEVWALGLIAMLYRYVDDPEFPSDLTAEIETCLLAFPYGPAAFEYERLDHESEERALVFHACEVLAGQRFPQAIFKATGRTGQWHQQHGAELALAWLSSRARWGFKAWDSGLHFARYLLALTHLLELAESETVQEMSAVMMDKVLFSLALNSYKGAFGSTHAQADTASVADSRMDPTAGISWLLWGSGCLNPHVSAPVSLVASKAYALPRLIESIALDTREEMWSREHHIGAPVGGAGAAEGVNKVTYKTPDYMLCSAQDYRAGEPGCREHIWQATMGPDAVVFVNHPTNSQQGAAYCSNLWRGNGVLPRVAQWRDTLIALYQVPDDDWMGFTHAHFPTAAFDEHTLREGWAFARRADAYLALTASRPFHLVTHGDTAYRELRCPGTDTVWVCQMGRAALDGSFESFQDSVLARPPQFGPLEVAWTTLRGEHVAFGWQAPLEIDGEEQPLTGFKHYETPYCTQELGQEQMGLQFGEWLMRLKFQTPSNSEKE